MNENTPRSKFHKNDNQNIINNFSNILSDLIQLNVISLCIYQERFSSIRNDFNKAVSVIKDSTEEKQKFERLIEEEIEEIKQESRNALSEQISYKVEWKRY